MKKYLVTVRDFENFKTGSKFVNAITLESLMSVVVLSGYDLETCMIEDDDEILFTGSRFSQVEFI